MTSLRRRISLSFLLVALGAPAPRLSADTLMLCYSYGCQQAVPVTLTRLDWSGLRAAFPEPRNAAEERVAIARAVAWFEQLAGQVTPIHRDRGGNPVMARQPGQLDCIDESLNTTALLILLDQQGLLHWHRVLERAYRAPWVLDQHWSAQIEEMGSGQRFVVDSWPQDNGQPALIQPYEDWRGRVRPAQLRIEEAASDS